MLRNWLRSRLGESRELAELRAILAARDAELTATNRELRAAYEDLTACRDRALTASRLAAARLKLIDRLVEPESSSCTKVRLYNRADAEAFARLVERESRAGQLEPYRCRECPRYPLNLARYWHVRHVDEELRGRRGRRVRDARPGDPWQKHLLVREKLDPAARQRLEDLGKES